MPSARAKRPSKAKAKEILRDGSVYGHPLTRKQRGFFGVIAGGRVPSSVKDRAMEGLKKK